MATHRAAPRTRRRRPAATVAAALLALTGVGVTLPAADDVGATVATPTWPTWTADPVATATAVGPAVTRPPSYLLIGILEAEATPPPVEEEVPDFVVDVIAVPEQAESGAPAAQDGLAVPAVPDRPGVPYPNGQIPLTELCPVTWAPGQYLDCAAAAALDDLNAAWTADFGAPIAMTDTYRTFDAQVACKLAKPVLCATPGTSNHGWGRAIDFAGGIEDQGTAEHAWMEANAARFGWVNPDWAQPTGAKPEPWHWEFAP